MLSKVYPKWLQLALLATPMSEEAIEASCACDPSVGAVPCEACVIRDALLKTKTLCNWVRAQIEHEAISGVPFTGLAEIAKLVLPELQQQRGPVTHDLKTWPEYFGPVARGEKHFEGRKDDRNFLVGDFLHLQEWEPRTGTYTGNECMARITYKLTGVEFGIAAGWCVLSIEVLETGFLVRDEVEPRAPGASKRPPARPEDYGGAY